MKQNGKRLKWFDLRFIVSLMGLVIIIVFFQIVTGGRLFGNRTFSTLFNEVFNIIIAGCGVLFVMCEGNIDFSIGSIIGLTSALAAMASKQIGWWCIIPIMALGGMVISSLCGFLIAYLKLPSFIATIGISFMIQGITTIILDAGPLGCDFGFMKVNNITLKVIVLMVFMAIMFTVFTFTKFARQCKAIGANRVVAEQSGINVKKMIMIPYMISGACAGLVGAFNLAKSLSAAATTGSGFHFNVMLALMLGGFSIAGGWGVRFKSIIIGACMYAVILMGLTAWGVSTDMQQLVKGCIFIIAVAASFNRKSVQVIT